MKLRDIWISECVNQGDTGRVDANSWLSKVALDIIGLAGAFAGQVLSSSSDACFDAQDSIMHLTH
jgi:hypothetical protein